MTGPGAPDSRTADPPSPLDPDPDPAQLAGRVYDRLATAVLAVVAVLVVVTVRDYGVSNDEAAQHEYGRLLWSFYLSGFDDRSAFEFRNLHLYGGLFDMVASALVAVSPLDRFDTRHLLCGLIGVGGIAAAWRTARLLAGPRAGFLAAAILACSASWYGPMFNNTKDIPFATGMTCLLWLGCRLLTALPRPSPSLVVGWGAALGATMAIRVGAGFAVLALAAALGARLLGRARGTGGGAALQDALAIGRALLPALPAALVVTAVFWPWAVLSPLNPLIAAADLTEFSIRTPIFGRYYDSRSVPPYYVPAYLLVKLPEVTLAGVALALGFAAAALAAADRRARLRTLHPGWLLLALGIVLPLAFVVVERPALYNGVRHFLFLIPPLSIAAAVGWDRLWRSVEAHRRTLGHVVAAVLALAAGREIAAMAALHPHQYVSYNALVGGLRGAAGGWELDYWSNFTPEATAWLVHRILQESGGRAPETPITVGLCTEPEALQQRAPAWLVPVEDWTTADVIMSTTNAECHLYGDGRIVFEVRRRGVTLGVIRDRRPEGAPTAR